MSSIAAPSLGIFRKVTVRDAAVLLAMAWLIPFLVHLYPWSGARPLGAYLLPMFWATLVAVYFFGARMGIVTGLFGPAINVLVTGLPAWRYLSLMGIELVVFALVLAWGVRNWPRVWVLAPLGYLVARSASLVVQSTTYTFGHVTTPLASFAHTVVGTAAGLGVLAVINLALVKCYPKEVQPAP